MASLRMEEHMEEYLADVSQRKGMSKSEYIRQTLKEQLMKEKEKEESNAWEIAQQYCGKYDSGRSDLSTQRKTILKDKLREKRSRY